jgi:hypothetical protein
MLKLLRGRITFSNVIALLALFFALGGGVYAAQIKKNSLTTKQIKDSTLKGVGSAKALSRVTYQTASGTLTPGATSPLIVTATCPSGQVAIGGGAAVGKPYDPNFSDVSDATFTADHSGFVARGFTDVPGGPDTLTVTAACAPVRKTKP